MKHIFIPVTKVDAEKRLVYGTAAIEELDKSGEIFDYETSKPLFQKWSEDVAASTLAAVQAFGDSALSYGNVREMHTKSAAGKLAEPLKFNDVTKAIEVCSYVSDDAAWKKVTEGVYTGFSMGGAYVNKWDDPMVKLANQKAAKRYTAQPNEISLVDVPCIPGATFEYFKGAEGSELRKFTTVQLTAADIPQALYKVCEGLAAASAPGVTKAVIDSEHTRALRVMKRAKELNVDVSGFAEAYVKLHGGVTGDKLTKSLKKGMYNISDLASAIMTLNWCQSDLAWEAEYEGDGSELPARLKEVLATLSQILVDLATEETAEMLDAAKSVKDQIGKETDSVKKFFEVHGKTIQKMSGSTDPDQVAMAKQLNEMSASFEVISKAHAEIGASLKVLNGEPEAPAPVLTDAEKLAKAAAAPGEERLGNMEKAVSNINETLQLLLKRTPAEPTVAITHPVAKVADTGSGDPAPAIDPKDPDAAMKMMKRVHGAGPTLAIVK